MDAFLSAHADKITGELSLFDRILIKGHLPLGYPRSSCSSVRARAGSWRSRAELLSFVISPRPAKTLHEGVARESGASAPDATNITAFFRGNKATAFRT